MASSHFNAFSNGLSTKDVLSYVSCYFIHCGYLIGIFFVNKVSPMIHSVSSHTHTHINIKIHICNKKREESESCGPHLVSITSYSHCLWDPIYIRSLASNVKMINLPCHIHNEINKPLVAFSLFDLLIIYGYPRIHLDSLTDNMELLLCHVTFTIT